MIVREYNRKHTKTNHREENMREQTEVTRRELLSGAAAGSVAVHRVSGEGLSTDGCHGFLAGVVMMYFKCSEFTCARHRAQVLIGVNDPCGPRCATGP